jgi:Magnesium chelatase, subunit ChlI
VKPAGHSGRRRVRIGRTRWAQPSRHTDDLKGFGQPHCLQADSAWVIHWPAMSLAEALETTRIPRVAGLTGDRLAWVTTRPFRAPHHTISDVGLIGGGQVPRPGEVSLAHHGVRWLDARPACRRHALETLRQPLEESVI